MTDLGFYAKKCWYLAFMIVAVAAGFYFNSSWKSGLRTELSSADQELKSMQTEIALSQQRMEEYQETLRQFSVYSNFIFAEDDPQRLIDRLKADAGDKDVILNDIQFDIPEFIKSRDNTRTMALMKFQISLVGGYYHLWEFIKTLEDRPYLDGIDEMNLSSNNPEGSILKMDLKGTFRVFDKKMAEWCVNDGT